MAKLRPCVVVVDRISYRKDDFVVLQTTSAEYGALPVVGSFPFGASQIREGLSLAIHGVKISDPKWGEQIKPGPVLLPFSTNPRVVFGGCEIGSKISYLEVTLASKTQDHVALADAILQGSVEKVVEITGLSLDIAEQAVSGWVEFIHSARVGSALRTAGATAAETVQIAKGGIPLADVLKNPWILTEKHLLSLSKVDLMAQNLGVEVTPEVRARILVQDYLERCQDDGDSCVNIRFVVAELVKNFPDWDFPRCVALLKDLHDKAFVKLSRVPEGEIFVYLPILFKWENEGTELLAKRLVSAQVDKDSMYGVNLQGSCDDLKSGAYEEAQTHTHLSPHQRQALQGAFLHPVFLLTGLPGTGKTTTLRALVSSLKKLGARVLAVAPTGVAARRMRQLCNIQAETFHAAFCWQPGRKQNQADSYVGLEGGNKNRASEQFENDWGYGNGRHVEADVLIIDESSMVDLALFYRALAATPPTCRVVFVGDPAQIPSVGPGSVLRDLLKVPQIARIHLDAIFRQSAASPVVQAAHAIHKGRVPTMREVTTSQEALNPPFPEDVCLLRVGSAEEALRLGCEVVEPLYQDEVEVGSVQLLSPRHGGTAGVTSFNEQLRAHLNPSGSGSEVKVSSGVIRQNDRVMVVKNDRELNVYNGDVGCVKNAMISAGVRMVEVRIDGTPPHLVTLQRDQPVQYLRLAYAVTIHKSQAMEYEVVVIVLLPSFGNQVTRRLLYTAITRAKKRAIIIGTSDAMAAAIGRTGDDTRISFLAERSLQHCKDLASCSPPSG